MKFCAFKANKSPTNIAYFVMSNPAIPRNYLVMACRHSALLGLLSALGALGRRFESCRPDQL